MGLFNSKKTKVEYASTELAPVYVQIAYNAPVELANEYVGNDVSIVELDVDIPVFDGPKTFRGEAKRSPEDRFDEDIAITLAYARAFTSIANKLNKRAAGLLKHQDDTLKLMAEQKEARILKAKKEAAAAKRRATLAAKKAAAARW